MYSGTTTHYNLPQYVANDVPSILGDLNTAYEDIDTAIYGVASSAATAETKASTALESAGVAVTTAQSAQSDATQALTDVAQAQSDATQALADAQSAGTAAASALTTAQSASSTAQSASNTAQSAATDATAALNAVSQASSDAATALATANSANTTAGNAMTTAGAAQSAATSAGTAAAAAQSGVDGLDVRVTALEQAGSGAGKIVPITTGLVFGSAASTPLTGITVEAELYVESNHLTLYVTCTNGTGNNVSLSSSGNKVWTTSASFKALIESVLSTDNITVVAGNSRSPSCAIGGSNYNIGFGTSYSPTSGKVLEVSSASIGTSGASATAVYMVDYIFKKNA